MNDSHTTDTAALIKQLEQHIVSLENTATTIAAQLGVLGCLRLSALNSDDDEKGFEHLVSNLALALEETAANSVDFRCNALKKEPWQ